MIKIFTQVVRGTNTIEKLASLNKKSRNFISEVLSDLEKEGFIAKKKYFSAGSRISFEASSTDHALKLKELLFEYHTISFEELLADSKLLFLAALSGDWTTIDASSSLSGISKHMIARYKPMLQNRGIIARDGDLFMVNRKAWPLLADFLLSYKNYAVINGSLKWRYQDELLFEVDDKSLVQGCLSGLAKYKDYGVKVLVVKALCRLPKARLSKEEVFVHSLFQVDDSRTLSLALTFYLKNKMHFSKVLPIAMKYGKYTLFTSMIRSLKEESALPYFDRNNFKRIAHMYGVKNV